MSKSACSIHELKNMYLCFAKVDNSGQVKTNSELLGQRKPQTFYRSTRLAAWRVYRHHQPPDDIMKLVAKSAAADKKARRKLTFAMRRPSTIPRGLSFSEYSKCCNQVLCLNNNNNNGYF